MAKTPSIRLFRLINTLSGSEKRYFKLYISQHGKKDSKYLLLFHEMDKMVDFDEEKLKKIIYKGKTIQSRKYSELKAYLYDLILKSLQSFDEQSSIDSKLKSMLQGIRSLFKRSLFEDCHLLILKAEKIAQKYEDFKVVIELQGWKKKVAYAQLDTSYLNNELNKINEIESKAILQLQNLIDYEKIFFKLYLARRKNPEEKFKKKKDNILLEQFISKDFKEAHSHLALIRLYRIKAFYHYAEGNFKFFFNESAKLVEAMEVKPYFLKEDLSEYISALSNFAIGGIFIKNYEIANLCLKKLQAISPLTLDDITKKHRQYYSLKFGLCLLTGDFEEGVITLNAHLREVKKLDKKLFDRDNFLFQYFYIQFGAENYDESLYYLNQWLSLPKRIERQDLWITARLVNLILHYEMGNTLLLDSLIRSTYRYLSKNNILSPYEHKILTFFREVLKLQNKHQVVVAFKDLKIELQKEKYQKTHPKDFDMTAWFDSKIQQRKFQDIIKEKFNKSLIHKV